MKLAKIQIENFRHLGTGGKPFELDFTDPLGRVRDFTLLVGPNTSGKTTVLDAIAAALGPMLGVQTTRRDFNLYPSGIVPRGELNTRVTCWLHFGKEEIAAAKAVYRVLSDEDAKLVTTETEVKVTWTYPDPSSNKPNGSVTSAPKGSAKLLYARKKCEDWLQSGLTSLDMFRPLGSVFTFDQHRTGLGRTIPRQIWTILHGESSTPTGKAETTDPHTILITLALQSLVPAVGKKRDGDTFGRIKELYGQVCAPHELLGAKQDDLGKFGIRFRDGLHEYGYDGVSGGERMLLLLLIRFAAEHIHNSIVLIDELELNQHPIWQRRLLNLIPKMGVNNQIIATTHSPYLRDAVMSDEVIDLGAIDDRTDAGAKQ